MNNISNSQFNEFQSLGVAEKGIQTSENKIHDISTIPHPPKLESNYNDDDKVGLNLSDLKEEADYQLGKGFEDASQTLIKGFKPPTLLQTSVNEDGQHYLTEDEDEKELDDSFNDNEILPPTSDEFKNEGIPPPPDTPPPPDEIHPDDIPLAPLEDDFVPSSSLDHGVVESKQDQPDMALESKVMLEIHSRLDDIKLKKMEAKFGDLAQLGENIAAKVKVKSTSLWGQAVASIKSSFASQKTGEAKISGITKTFCGWVVAGVIAAAVSFVTFGAPVIATLAGLGIWTVGSLCIMAYSLIKDAVKTPDQAPKEQVNPALQKEIEAINKKPISDEWKQKDIAAATKKHEVIHSVKTTIENVQKLQSNLQAAYQAIDKASNKDELRDIFYTITQFIRDDNKTNETYKKETFKDKENVLKNDIQNTFGIEDLDERKMSNQMVEEAVTKRQKAELSTSLSRDKMIRDDVKANYDEINLQVNTKTNANYPLKIVKNDIKEFLQKVTNLYVDDLTLASEQMVQGSEQQEELKELLETLQSTTENLKDNVQTTPAAAVNKGEISSDEVKGKDLLDIILGLGSAKTLNDTVKTTPIAAVTKKEISTDEVQAKLKVLQSHLRQYGRSVVQLDKFRRQSIVNSVINPPEIQEIDKEKRVNDTAKKANAELQMVKNAIRDLKGYDLKSLDKEQKGQLLTLVSLVKRMLADTDRVKFCQENILSRNTV